MALELNDYRAAIALAEHRHFGRAADALQVSQPSLTSRLRRMEDQLGARLFERDRRGVEPTSIGLAFLKAAEQVVRAARQAEAAAHDAAAGAGQVLRVGFTQIAAQITMVGALASFRAQRPAIRLRLMEAPSARLERDLADHRLDVAFLHPPLQTPRLRLKALSESAGRRVRLTLDAPPNSVIGYPTAEAPSVMTRLSEGPLDRDGDAVVDTIADSVLGAIVLARAGYGEALVPAGYDHPLLQSSPARRERAFDAALTTAVASRAADRRDAVETFFEAAAAAAGIRATG